MKTAQQEATLSRFWLMQGALSSVANAEFTCEVMLVNQMCLVPPEQSPQSTRILL